MRPDKRRPGDEQLILDDMADVVDRVCAFERLASDGIRSIRPVAERWVTDDHPFLREHGIAKLLIYWKDDPRHDSYVNTALRMLAEDPDIQVRSGAAISLKPPIGRDDLHRDRILRALVRQLETDPDDIVQKTCYEALLDVLRPDRGYDLLPDPFDRDRDVDWDLLAPWRGPRQG